MRQNGTRINGEERARKRISLKHEHLIEITRLLTLNGQKNTGGVYVYNDGWSDVRIKDEVHKPYPVEKVVEIRKAHFGMLEDERATRTRTPGPVLRQFEDKIAELERRLEAVEQIVAPLRETN